MKDEAVASSFRLHLVGGGEAGNGPIGQDGDPTQVEIQEYIADMLEELRELSRTSGLRSLTAVLEFATRCAQSEAGRPPDTGRG